METNLFFYLIIFLFGLGIGSFLNSIVFRLQVDESFLLKRSFCPNCKHKLSWKDLIPLLSFLILKGKCRYCQNKISLQYPLVELVTGILFVLIFYYCQSFLFAIYCLVITCFLIIIFVYDLKHYIIPDKIIYPAILISVIWYLVASVFLNLYTKYDIFGASFAALLAAIFFLVIVLISRGKWMGVGDIKLALLLGLFLGWPNILVALFLAFFVGAIIGIGLVISGKKTFKSEVPFGPFLVGGTFITFFLGEKIINWYFNFFNLVI
ncbi:prepilin peptidase [Patescibacteria group bacterium]